MSYYNEIYVLLQWNVHPTAIEHNNHPNKNVLIQRRKALNYSYSIFSILEVSCSMTSTNCFSHGITLKFSQKSESYLKCVSAKTVRVGIRSFRWNRVTPTVSILQVTISNQVWRDELPNHWRFCLTLKWRSPRTWLI